MTVGELKLQFVEKKVPDDCKIYMAHSKLDYAYDVTEEIELSAMFMKIKNAGLHLERKRNKSRFLWRIK